MSRVKYWSWNILLRFLVMLFFIIVPSFYLSVYRPGNILASSYTCPPEYNLYECYEYLEKQKDKVAKQRRDLKKELSRLSSEEDSVYSKLRRINAQIKDIQLQIKEIHFKIEMLSVQIEDYSNKAKVLEEQIDNLVQESERIREQMGKTYSIKYAVNSIPWYFYLAKGDLYSLFEMMEVYRYLLDTSAGKVAYYQALTAEIKEKLRLLKKQKAKIDENRAKIEKENEELVKLKEQLAGARAKQQALLARLKQDEKKIEAQMAKLKSVENAVDKALTEVLLQMWAEGNLPGNGATVAKGSIIGYQGHTGCSFGSHLHFAMYKVYRSGGYRRVAVNPLSSGYLGVSGGYLISKKARAPENKALITQWFHEGYALDMVSLSDGLHNGSKYCKNKYSIRCPSYIYSTSWFKSLPKYSCFNQTGEGAPVFAVLGGKIYRGVDRYGSKYALIDHGNGLVSIYYHLK